MCVNLPFGGEGRGRGLSGTVESFTKVLSSLSRSGDGNYYCFYCYNYHHYFCWLLSYFVMEKVLFMSPRVK